MNKILRSVKGSCIVLILLPLLYLLVIVECHAQVKVDRSYGDFNLSFEEGKDKTSVWFRKHPDSSAYSQIVIHSNKQGSEPIQLNDEVEPIRRLWSIAEDSIAIHLTGCMVDYPYMYEDVLKRQIEAFRISKKWHDYVNKNKNKIDSRLVASIMNEYHVYKPLEDLIDEKGYTVTGFSNEKHGFMEAKELVKMGYTGKETIPIPYLIYMKLQHKLNSAENKKE